MNMLDLIPLENYEYYIKVRPEYSVLISIYIEEYGLDTSVFYDNLADVDVFTFTYRTINLATLINHINNVHSDLEKIVSSTEAIISVGLKSDAREQVSLRVLDDQILET